MNIGIIGGGAIAQFLLKKINLEQKCNAHIKSIYIRDKERYDDLANKFNLKLYTDYDLFLNSNIDLVIEAATVKAVKRFAPKTIKQKSIIIASAGAFADELFTKNMYSLIKQYKNKVYLPSGAIGGLDLLKNANVLNEVEEVMLTTRKPANSLIDGAINQEKVVFNGTANEAIKKFPANINVSIILSLAGLGVHETKVKVIADPHINKNNHSIDIRGSFGRATINVENNPLKENPKTSHLAALSILGTLQSMEHSINII